MFAISVDISCRATVHVSGTHSRWVVKLRKDETSRSAQPEGKKLGMGTGLGERGMGHGIPGVRWWKPSYREGSPGGRRRARGGRRSSGPVAASDTPGCRCAWICQRRRGTGSTRGKLRFISNGATICKADACLPTAGGHGTCY